MEDMGQRLYDAAQLRELERRTIAGGTPGYVLMQRAAAACWREILLRWPQLPRIDVLCGPGNNGGDGYEIARLARAAGREVRVWRIGGAPLRGDALQAHAAWQREGGSSADWHPGAFESAGLIVDALFGIGLSRELDADARRAVGAIADSGATVVAVDVPSGIDSDSGRVLGSAVRARLTVTFIARKLGLYQGEAPEHAGEIVLDELGIDPTVHAGMTPPATLLAAARLRDWLPPRDRQSHKGRHGHVLVVGGDCGMAGAALLAARGALRAGAGLVSVATRAAHAPMLVMAQSELMGVAVESTRDLQPLIERADVVLIGPGLGQDAWGRAMFSAVLEAPRPLLLDADALNLLAQEPSRRDDWVLTPHPGEAARLLGRSNSAVQADRLAAGRELQEKFGGVGVLKGAGTLVRGRRTQLCPHGNPGMAVGGMGDVLAGVVAALMGQGLPLEDAAAAGVLAHACAGDAAARMGQRGLLPSDLLQELRAAVNP